MKRLSFASCVFSITLLFVSGSFSFGQASPDLENGFKNFGSFDSSKLDTVNLINGNLIVHIPMPWTYPQRGGSINPHNLLTMSSKTWSTKCFILPPVEGSPQSTAPTCYWTPGIWRDQIVALAGSGLGFDHTLHISLHRVWGYQTDTASNVFYFSTPDSINTPDGGSHPLQPTPGAALDPNGDPLSYDSSDTSGFHVDLSNPSPTDGTPMTSIVSDQHGNRYTGTWITQPGCRAVVDDALPANSSSKSCEQATRLTSITDLNGNVFTPTQDTMGRPFSSFTFLGSGDATLCILNGHAFASSSLISYAGPNGNTNQAKLCYATIPISTNFGVPGVNEGGSPTAVANGSPASMSVLVTVVLPDNNNVVSANSPTWVFDYDSYINLTSIKLPTGGSISYTWETLNFGTPCNKVSRAVASRTLSDNLGHNSQWYYHFNQPGSGPQSPISNSVTDPLNNDVVHVFSDVLGHATCPQYETQTLEYSGSSSGGQLLRETDTSYTSITGLDVVPVSIQTTVFPSGKSKLVTKTYDRGAAQNQASFGNVVTEKEYDWGGALLRETDTTYQWQINSAYLNARILDIPSSVIVKDGFGNRIAETDYTYDEPTYITHFETSTDGGALPANTHVSAPNAVRGLQTTVSRWLNTNNSLIASHTLWFDTGEPYQSIDPLNHVTKHIYGSTYAGAFPVQTCNAKNQCVSATYDFNTGAVATFTDANNNTSNYAYDGLGRTIDALSPPDAGGIRPHTHFTIASGNTFPQTVQRQQWITSSLINTTTHYFDGLARLFNSQQLTPQGTINVDTTFDALSRPVTVSNPYYVKTEPSYGNVTRQLDALGRATTVVEQDGSIASVDFSEGNCVTSTDEVGHQRQTCNDALGRLVQVNEPGNPSNFVANYHANLAVDGNFAVLDSTGDVEWESATHGVTNTSYSLAMQDDGNLVKYTPTWSTGTATTTGTAAYGTQPCIGYRLFSGQTLPAGSCLQSLNKRFVLYMQTDGNLVLYDLSFSTWNPIFYTGTAGAPAGTYLLVQTDGNLVVYTPSGTPLWWTGTVAGSGTYVLQVQDPGNLVLYKDIWETATTQAANGVTSFSSYPCSNIGIGISLNQNIPTGSCLVSPSGRFRLLMQTDGNLVLYDGSVNPPSALWSTGTTVPVSTMALSSQVALQTLYFYDALGNLLCVEQHGGVSGTGCSASPASDASSPWRVRRFTYDSLSRLLTAHNPESGTITYAYDADDNLLQKSSPAPNQTGSATQTISYCYDELHRVTSKAYSAQSCPLASPVVTYAYDVGANAKGKLTSLTDQAGSASYSYDALGRISSETRVIAGVSKQFTYDYNLDGSLWKLHYPSGRVITYTPDSAGRTVSAADSNGTTYASATFYANGAEYQRSMPGIYFRNDLNNRLEPSGFYSDNGQVASFFVNRTYTYGVLHQNNGNITSIIDNKDSTRTQTFTYDALNRITSGYSTAATGTYSWGETYSIDPWGNLNIAPMAGKAHGGTFSNASNNNNQPLGFTYDAAGNLTNTTQYVYDPENRIQSTAGYVYTYDADGQRVLKSNSSGTPTKRYWMGNGNILAEADGSGNLTAEYVFFGGKRLVRIDLPANTAHYYLSDHLGSTSKIISATGVVEEESDFTPYGSELTAAQGTNHYKFTGKERDTETQLDYFGARYYSSAMGRWVSPDWSDGSDTVPNAKYANPQTLNLYNYVLNNPLTNLDPDGHDVHVCLSTGQCFDLNDSQWKELQKNPGPGITFDLNSFGSGTFSCGGVVCGSSQYFEPGLSDDSAGLMLMAIPLERLAAPVLEKIGAKVGARLGKVLARGGAKAGEALVPPAYAKTAGGFVNWLKNLSHAGVKLTEEQADAIIAQAKDLKVDVRLDPPHPGTNWDVPHLNIGKEGQVHLEVPSGYDHPDIPKGSVRRP